MRLPTSALINYAIRVKIEWNWHRITLINYEYGRRVDE